MGRGQFRRACMALAVGGAMAVGMAGCAIGGGARQQPARSTGGPPAALATLDANATGIIDSATARDWNRVSAQLAAIHQSWTALSPDLTAHGARSGLLDATSGAISALDHQSNQLAPRGTAQAANRLTAFIPDMQALYPSKVPPQLAEMVYLGRAIQFHADSSHSAAVWDDTRALETQWAYIRPAAQKASNGDAARLDLQIADLDAAIAKTIGSAGATMPAMTFAAIPAAVQTSGTVSAVASSAAAGVGVLPSQSGSNASSASSSSATSSTTSKAAAGTPANATAPRRTGTMAGPASSPAAMGPVQKAAAAILSTLTALQRDFQGTAGA